MKVNLKDFIQKYIHMCLSDIKLNLYTKNSHFYLIQVQTLSTLVTDSALNHSLNDSCWRDLNDVTLVANDAK